MIFTHLAQPLSLLTDKTMLIYYCRQVKGKKGVRARFTEPDALISSFFKEHLTII